MTTPSSNDDMASIATAPLPRAPAPTAVEALWQNRAEADARSRASRILGRSPLSRHARDRFGAALGEVRTAERLRTLSTSGEPWRVLHAIPVLAGGPEVDHLVIGPGGVFTLSTASRDESAPGVLAREPEIEARRATAMLTAALGRPCVVRAIVVVIEPGRRPSPVGDGVDVVGLDRMVRHLRSLAPVQSVDEVREVTRVALKPRTWRPDPSRLPATQSDPMRADSKPAGALSSASRDGGATGSHSHPTASELGFWFARLRSDVDRARRIRIAWITTALGILASAASIAPMIVQQLPG